MVNQNKKIAELITISGAIKKIENCSVITCLPYCQLLPDFLHSGRLPPYFHNGISTVLDKFPWWWLWWLPPKHVGMKWFYKRTLKSLYSAYYW